MWRSLKAQIAHGLVVGGGRRRHEGERIDLLCHLLAFVSQGSWEDDGGVSAQLEPHGRSRREIFDDKVHVEGAMMERVGDFQSEGPGKMFQVFGRVLHGKSHTVLMLLHHSPLAFAHEPVFGDVIFASFVSEGAIPRTAHDGEEDGRVSAPESFVAMPDDGSSTVEEVE